VLCVDTDSGLVVDGSATGEDFIGPDGNLSPALKQALDFLMGWERSRKATDVAVAALAAAHKDCTPAPLPTIRVIEAPKSGTLTVRRGELKTDQVAGCPGLKTPAQVVFYQARAGTLGTDHPRL
jgi:hypothetical protein